MINKIPPLRLVVNSICNGHCSYCHFEGNDSDGEMPLETIRACAIIANKLSIPNVAITGGEPTLRNDLVEIIKIISEESPDSKISITTNGAMLFKLIDKKPLDIYNLNLSISSFNKEIAKKYQNVDPSMALKAFKTYNAKSKNLNIVITKDNYLEIDIILEYCINNSISLDLMFELKKYDIEDIGIQKYVFSKLETIGKPYILLENIPKLVVKVSHACTITVKHPLLSSMQNFDFCQSCDQNQNCFERICAIRVFPDSSVSPCLLKKPFKSDDLLTQISNMYSNIINGSSNLSFIYNKTFTSK